MLKNLPQATKNLLILNVIFYLISLIISSNGLYDVNQLAGAHYFNSVFFKPFQIVTHMFLHSLTDPFHIIFNMLILVMFGGHLERVWGAKRYFIFYIASGVGALVLYNSIGVYQIFELKETLSSLDIDNRVINDLIVNKPYLFDSTQLYPLEAEINDMIQDGLLPENIVSNFEPVWEYIGLNRSTMVGASGALFGVLAGFAVLFPNTELMLIFPPIPIKAKYLIGGYIAYEIYNSLYRVSDSIAHLAHVGGAIVGIILVLYWRRTDRSNFW